MAEKYHQKTLKRIQTIIKTGQKNIGRKKDPLLENFIKQFYLHTPFEVLTSTRPAYLYAAALECWKFMSQRTPAERKVRVYNPEMTEHGWESERTIVELNTDDSPFILDSVTAELVKNGHHIYEIMHPVLRLRRNKNGLVSKLYENGEGEGKDGLESVMHFQISHISEEPLIQHLQHNIENVLHFVHLTVSDWPAMIGRARQISESLDSETLPFPKEQVDELRDFLEWSIDNNFIFLGYREYDFVDKKGHYSLSTVEGSELGIFNANNVHGTQPLGLKALPPKSLNELQHPTLVEITKASRKSIVHRPVHMDYIGVKKFDSSGNVVGEHRLLGLFTSSVYYQSARLIPIIRKKLDAVVRRSGFQEDSHNGKALVTILESYPRDELLQISEDDLFEISMGILELGERPRTKLFVRKDRFSRFVSCIVFIPRDRFNTQLREKVQTILEESFSGTITDHYIQVSESPLARLHLLIKIESVAEKEPDHKTIEDALVEATNNWINGLHDTLVGRLGERVGEKLYAEYVEAFPESFKNSYHFGGTFCDIIKMEEAFRTKNLTMDLYQLQVDSDLEYQLKIYHTSTQVMLSDVMPVLENMGFHAIDERTFFIEPAYKEHGVWVHHFRLRVSRSNLFETPKGDYRSAVHAIKHEFEEALFKVWHQDIENDALNKLILRGNLRWRDVVMLRAYSKYIIQTAFSYSHDIMASTIARHPKIARMLVDLFQTRFSPDIENSKREQATKELLASINRALIKVESVADDRIIRQFLDTITATLRTNYFQKDSQGAYKSYLSFKFDSAKVPNLPLPRPYREIFVYSRDVEGIHLRGGKVARGGLRWSDRREDFRTEVLGLMKAQMTKNAVIVPVGSKGGFVVKHEMGSDRDQWLKRGQDCYRTYLSGLLDITDNIVSGKVVPPKEVVRHDQDDPYLVVAADKGTATFSDIANGVAQSYGFWLDDAFASGGSVGYDHKKMGITARGAWVSVQRHFFEMGIDVQSEDFTVVGIGDMSGDVFGNGMLLSEHIRLVGAFNHLHIFVDPNPDAAASYKERKRLFELPRSSWTDYNEKLISKGGAIFERSAKTLTLTREIQERFDIAEKKVTPDELIKAILRANVDLLWNGGIGTYVKAEGESHEMVGDKTNDLLRVNARELRCKVIGEGGNLGLTQRSRIEYALNNGRINTDSIDNSAGVDCSDHEVNIKIALRKAMAGKKISLKTRNSLLAKMTDEVAELVLRDNRLQTLAISINAVQGHKLIEQKARLMRALEEKGLLNRNIEFLPQDEELVRRQAMEQGLTRPELAVILSYSKLDLYNELIDSNLPDEPYFKQELLMYFPEAMRKRFESEITSHELRREIIVTTISNSIINRMGSSFYHRIMEDTGMKGCDIARGYTIARDAFGLRELWQEIEALGRGISAEIQAELYLDMRQLVERATLWFLRNASQPLNVSNTIEEFSKGIKELTEQLDHIIPEPLKRRRNTRQDRYVVLGVPKALAKKIANLDVLSSACDIVYVARSGTLPIRVVGEVYYRLGTKLDLAWLRINARRIGSHAHWERLASQTLSEMLYDQQMRLARDVIQSACNEKSCEGALEQWCERKQKPLARYGKFIEDLQKQENISHSMLTVAIQRVEALCAS